MKYDKDNDSTKSTQKRLYTAYLFSLKTKIWYVCNDKVFQFVCDWLTSSLVELSDLFEHQFSCSLLIDLTRHVVFNTSESASNHVHFWTFVPRLLHNRSSSESSLINSSGSLSDPMFQRSVNYESLSYRFDPLDGLQSGHKHSYISRWILVVRGKWKRYVGYKRSTAMQGLKKIPNWYILSLRRFFLPKWVPRIHFFFFFFYTL